MVLFFWLYFTLEGSHSLVAVGRPTILGDNIELSPMFNLESKIQTHKMCRSSMHRQVALNSACPENMGLDPNPSAICWLFPMMELRLDIQWNDFWNNQFQWKSIKKILKIILPVAYNIPVSFTKKFEIFSNYFHGKIIEFILSAEPPINCFIIIGI